jgi:signal transduction histidine kinase
MLAVPLVSLLALWGFAASITISAAIKDQAYNSSSKTTNAGVYGLVSQLPQERAQTYIWLLTGRRAPKAQLVAARQQLDLAIPPARTALVAIEGTKNPVLGTLIADLGGIPNIRKAVDAGTMSPSAAFAAYSNIVDEVFGYFDSTVNERSGAGLGGISVGAVAGAYALEMASREAALIDGTLTNGGRLTPDIRELFAGAAAQRHELLREAQALVPADLYPSYVNNSPAYQQFQAMETQILNSTGNTLPVNGQTWATVTTAYLESTYKTQNTTDAPRLQAMSVAESDRLLTEAIVAGGVGLAAVVVSLFLLIWFGRKFTRDLGGLNTSVREMAEERLPRVVDRLRRGEDVDVHAESPPPASSSIREVSAIADSFGTVQGAAVAAAVDQARLRKGVSQVFLNISMRNQSLLHRQLKMLDSMERRTSDPTALAELFRLDHLTTRMRRHAEGLIILSGSTPGRGWREPVPVVDVLRAAVAEVEDYVRVDVLSESRDLVAGNAVNDLIHLIAELVENATVFSPPNTRIEVRADRVGTGLVAEIDDRGLGLNPQERDVINRRLASPPDFDPASSDQLGLFIVSRLAARHRIMVSLRESAYGGTTAIMRIPFGVIIRDEDQSPVADENWVIPQDMGGGSPEQGGTGRHRVRMAATGRVAEAGNFGDTGNLGDTGNIPGPRSVPRAPWEMDPPLPVPEPLLPGPGAPALNAGRATSTTGPLTQYAGRPTPNGGQPNAGRPTPNAGRPTPNAGRPTPSAGRPTLNVGRPTQSAGSPAPSGGWPVAGGGRPTPAAGPMAAGADPRALPSAAMPSGPGASGLHLGMPIRVPQASMAPQLRDRRQAARGTEAFEEASADDRAPEAVRDMMTLMQRGWKRGRADDVDGSAGAGYGIDW